MFWEKRIKEGDVDEDWRNLKKRTEETLKRVEKELKSTESRD